MNCDKLALIEALIFTSEEPLSHTELADMTKETKKDIKEYIKVLKEEYNKKSHGIELKEYNNSYIFALKTELIPSFKDLKIKSSSLNLTQAALETLAIIAYKQPVTRGEIEEIRGVKAEKTLATLGKYKLIEELGRKETIGNPIVYGTTKRFLIQFDLEDLSQLPELKIAEE